MLMVVSDRKQATVGQRRAPGLRTDSLMLASCSGHGRRTEQPSLCALARPYQHARHVRALLRSCCSVRERPVPGREDTEKRGAAGAITQVAEANWSYQKTLARSLTRCKVGALITRRRCRRRPPKTLQLKSPPGCPLIFNIFLLFMSFIPSSSGPLCLFLASNENGGDVGVVIGVGVVVFDPNAL